MLVIKQLLVAIGFRSMKKYYVSQWLPATIWLPTFVLNRRKKLKQVYN